MPRLHMSKVAFNCAQLETLLAFADKAPLTAKGRFALARALLYQAHAHRILGEFDEARLRLRRAQSQCLAPLRRCCRIRAG